MVNSIVHYMYYYNIKIIKSSFVFYARCVSEIKHLYMLCSRFILTIFCDNLTSNFRYVLQYKTGTNVVRILTKHFPHLTSNWLSPRDSNNNNNSNINWLLLLLEIHKLLEKLVPPVLWNAQVGFPHRCLVISIHTRTHTHTHAHSYR